ncbi:hypothetical protein QYE76_063018 [Lolium multiflorum]|uniref:CCHC-type domain-containing protein n=1 Tax=Lolium multiflorum TaxID=4521 RepID=A0AAD8W6N0_LOLMU|nr:hypothetical protein QYE76_063018 [Lolium multiflorum]
MLTMSSTMPPPHNQAKHQGPETKHHTHPMPSPCHSHGHPHVTPALAPCSSLSPCHSLSLDPYTYRHDLWPRRATSGLKPSMPSTWSLARGHLPLLACTPRSSTSPCATSSLSVPHTPTRPGPRAPGQRRDVTSLKDADVGIDPVRPAHDAIHRATTHASSPTHESLLTRCRRRPCPPCTVTSWPCRPCRASHAGPYITPLPRLAPHHTTPQRPPLPLSAAPLISSPLTPKLAGGHQNRPKMEYQWECYQLGHGGELKFEKDLKQLVEYLGHPYPEFFGTSFNNQLGGSPRWEVSADLGRKLGAPMAPPNRNQDAMMQMIQMMMEDREAARAERQANLAALQQIAQNNNGHGNHDHPGSKLKNFQNTNPPMFSKTEEPLDADDWLQTMENNLEVAGVEAAEKVLFATHYLSGPARAWWTSARAMNAGQMMNWEDFKLKFSKYHVPQGLIKKMRDEFRELKQGRMSVVEYRDKFLTLSRYAPDETDTNEKRKERFLNGLHDQANENRKRRMMNQNGPHHTQKYRNNSSGGFTPRHNKPPAQNYRPNYSNNNGGPPKPGGNHNNHSYNNNSNPNNTNNHPNGNNNNTNTAPKTGSNTVPINPKDKSTVNCYECGVVGHYSNECPKKLARIAANTAAPAQQQRRFAGRRNQNNNNGRLYHMTATEAQEAPQTMPSMSSC